jgi:hypothetical protein
MHSIRKFYTFAAMIIVAAAAAAAMPLARLPVQLVVEVDGPPGAQAREATMTVMMMPHPI